MSRYRNDEGLEVTFVSTQRNRVIYRPVGGTYNCWMMSSDFHRQYKRVDSCVICSSLLGEEEKIKLLGDCGISICDSCAGKVARSYEQWHAGKAIPSQGSKPQRRKLSDTVRLRIFQRDGFQCKQCGEKRYLTIDHIIPLSRGGSSDDENLQTLCMRCNCSKGAKV
ncbi:HNH endonuclease [Leminorella grimontii]|uniref:HNH endonuclease n=1 Tax=Leminorella grimontii TaxID=82981 RepID=UPI0035A24B69